MGKTIIFYRTADGKCPVQEFLDSLSGKAAQKVAWVLSLVEDLDVVPSTYFKKLVNTSEIWDCRIQFGSNAYQVFCFFDGNSVIVLTHGLIKKTQKTPQGEIERADSSEETICKGGQRDERFEEICCREEKEGQGFRRRL